MSRYIDAEEIHLEKGEMNTYTEYGEGFNDGIKFCKAEIERMPDAKRKGHWKSVPSVTGLRYSLLECSACRRRFGEVIARADYEYCPHCGAWMKDDGSDQPV